MLSNRAARSKRPGVVAHLSSHAGLALSKAVAAGFHVRSTPDNCHVWKHPVRYISGPGYRQFNRPSQDLDQWIMGHFLVSRNSGNVHRYQVVSLRFADRSRHPMAECGTNGRHQRAKWRPLKRDWQIPPCGPSTVHLYCKVELLASSIPPQIPAMNALESSFLARRKFYKR